MSVSTAAGSIVATGDKCWVAQSARLDGNVVPKSVSSRSEAEACRLEEPARISADELEVLAEIAPSDAWYIDDAADVLWVTEAYRLLALASCWRLEDEGTDPLESSVAVRIDSLSSHVQGFGRSVCRTTPFPGSPANAEEEP